MSDSRRKLCDSDDRNERWHEHDPTRWCSFEFAVTKSLLAVSKLPGVYCEETQIMNCYLYMIVNYADVTYNHKYYVVNAWAIISGIWEKFSCAFPSNLSDELRFEWRTQIWVKSNHHSNLSETVWYPPDLSEPSNLSDHPELRESRSDHPELSASHFFEGGHLPGDAYAPGNKAMSWVHNGLTRVRHLTIIWTNAGLLLIGDKPQWNFNQNTTFFYWKMNLKMSIGNWRSFYLGLNMLTDFLVHP